MAKKILDIVKLHVPAGKANPAPPIGPALGKVGISIMEFCKSFNAKTQHLEQGLIVPAVITVYKDRSFSFIIKTSPASVLIKKAAGVEKGSGEPNKEKVGKITQNQLREIAEKKIDDLNAYTIEQAMKVIEGTARNMGILVE